MLKVAGLISDHVRQEGIASSCLNVSLHCSQILFALIHEPNVSVIHYGRISAI